MGCTLDVSTASSEWLKQERKDQFWLAKRTAFFPLLVLWWIIINLWIICIWCNCEHNWISLLWWGQVNLHRWSELLVPLVNMIKKGCENKPALLILLYLIQNQASAMIIPVLWPEPCRKWVRWTEENQHGAVNLEGLEWFWMKEWSLISCQVFSNIIRHYRRKLSAAKLANGGFKKYIVNYVQCVL